MLCRSVKQARAVRLQIRIYAAFTTISHVNTLDLSIYRLHLRGFKRKRPIYLHLKTKFKHRKYVSLVCQHGPAAKLIEYVQSSTSTTLEYGV